MVFNDFMRKINDFRIFNGLMLVMSNIILYNVDIVLFKVVLFFIGVF